MPSIDWSDIPDVKHEAKVKYPALGPGWYVMKVTHVDVGKSKDGFESWTLALVVTEPGPIDHPDVSPQYDVMGRRVWDSIFWGGATEAKAAHCLQRAKLIYSRLGAPLLETQCPEDLLGKYAKVEVETEFYNGREKNRVTFAGYDHYPPFPPDDPNSSEVPAGEPPPKRLDDSEIPF